MRVCIVVEQSGKSCEARKKGRHVALKKNVDKNERQVLQVRMWRGCTCWCVIGRCRWPSWWWCSCIETMSKEIGIFPLNRQFCWCWSSIVSNFWCCPGRLVLTLFCWAARGSRSSWRGQLGRSKMPFQSKLVDCPDLRSVLICRFLVGRTTRLCST